MIKNFKVEGTPKKDPRSLNLAQLGLADLIEELCQNQDGPCFCDEGCLALTDPSLRKQARAAIEAMREPTEGMEDAGESKLWFEPCHPTGVYQAMIDEALKK